MEHEALLTITARETGVPAPRVLAAGEPSDELTLIALNSPGTSIVDMDLDAIDDDVLI